MEFDVQTLLIAIAGIAGFILLVFATAIIRTRIKGRYDIKNTDIALAGITVALALLLTGQIRELGVGDWKIVSAIRSASNTPVSDEVLPIEPVKPDPKGAISGIPELVEKKTAALGFRLGFGGYYGEAIEAHFVTLTSYPFFEYIVINDENDHFFGLFHARQLYDLLRHTKEPPDFDSFAKWLNESDAEAIAGIPGFVSFEMALKKDTGRREALEQMDRLDAQTLPVIDEAGRFVGVVERSRLSASMLLDITRALE